MRSVRARWITRGAFIGLGLGGLLLGQAGTTNAAAAGWAGLIALVSLGWFEYAGWLVDGPTLQRVRTNAPRRAELHVPPPVLRRRRPTRPHPDRN